MQKFILLLFILSVLLQACSENVSKAKETNNTDVADWLSYSNSENNFTFKYPKDWEVIDEGFYKTAYGLTLQKIGKSVNSDNWIRINSPQFTEEGEGKCMAVDAQKICTYSKDVNILNIFQKVSASFKLRHQQIVQNKK